MNPNDPQLPDQLSLTDDRPEAYCPHGVDRNYFRCPACEGDQEETPYIVTVANIFSATSPEDAVKQMAVWLIDNADQGWHESRHREQRHRVVHRRRGHRLQQGR